MQGWECLCIPIRHDIDEGESRSHADRDACKGSTDTHKEAPLKSAATLELGNGFSQTVQTVRNEGESEAKVRTSNAFAEESISGSPRSYLFSVSALSFIHMVMILLGAML